MELQQDEFVVSSPAPAFGVSDAVALFNQIFETATPVINIVGEVANFKVNQGKWVFFDLKDEESSINCFMSVFGLRTAIEDGMRVSVVARPNITKWGKFSLTIQSVQPVGEGNIRKAFELLRAKLDKEGLFSQDRKRSLPAIPKMIGVISSTGAAGYADFIKIIGERFSGLHIKVADVQVQGRDAPDQIIAALRYFNEMENPPDVIALIRGGGSRDDLVAFDDELLVREISASRVPLITGVGHEVDVTLADLVADVRAATPSNAAQIIVPEQSEIISRLDSELKHLLSRYDSRLDSLSAQISSNGDVIISRIDRLIDSLCDQHKNLNQILRQIDPRLVLNRGYSIVRSEAGFLNIRPEIGDNIDIESAKFIIKAEVLDVKTK